MAAKKTTTQINTYDEELAKFAQAAAADKASAAGSQNTVSLKAGIINVGGTSHGSAAPLVVLASVPVNTYYKGNYDPANPVGPVCFAFAPEDKNAPMVPHKDSVMPQCADCASCPQNQFGSAVKADGTKGAGKACKNIERLVALIPGVYKDGKPVLNGSLDDAPMWTIPIPPTSVRNWAGYVVGTASLVKRPPFGVLTRMNTTPDPKYQFVVEFALDRNLTADEYGKVRDRLAEANALARTPYLTVVRETPAAAPAAKGKRKYA